MKYPGYPKKLTQLEMEEALNESLEDFNNRSPEWHIQVDKYLHNLLYSDDKKLIDEATIFLEKLMKPERKSLGFSKPMFSQEEEMLSDEYSEKAGKRMYKLLYPKKK
jgi:hypothetical protein